MKKVSIIIPSYNSINFLKETLDSVFNQTYSNFEIIIIDDHSTDGTFEFAQTIMADNITLKKNIGNGACAARNYGYKLSSGHYLQFLDADDLMSLDKIQKQVYLLDANPEHLAVCNTKHFHDKPEKGIVAHSNFLYSTNNPSEFLLNLYGAKGSFGMVQTSAWLTPRILIEKAGIWDESLSKDQDGEFFCRVAMASKGIVYEPNVLNYYRKHSHGLNIASKNQRKHLQSQLDALNSKAFQLQSEKGTVNYKKAMALQYKFLGVNAYPEFNDIYKQAFRLSNDFGGSNYIPILGGKIIEGIKYVFGWRAAKVFKKIIHSIIN